MKLLDAALIIGATYLLLRCNPQMGIGMKYKRINPGKYDNNLYHLGSGGVAGLPQPGPPIPLAPHVRRWYPTDEGVNVRQDRPYPEIGVAGYFPQGQATTTLYNQAWEKKPAWGWKVRQHETPYNGWDRTEYPANYDTVGIGVF